MEIEYNNYPSGMREICLYNNHVIASPRTISVAYLNRCYSFIRIDTYDEDGKYREDDNQDLKIDSDIVLNPKHLSVEDKQLLKILHPHIDSQTFDVYYVLKGLIDGDIGEDEVFERIKEILY